MNIDLLSGILRLRIFFFKKAQGTDYGALGWDI